MKKHRVQLIKSVFVNIINIILLVAIIVLIRKIPAKAQSIKDLFNQQEAAREGIDLQVLSADLQNNQEKIKQLDSLFADEKGILPVIEALSNMKNSGLIQEFNIADNQIKNKSGQIGLPIYVKGSGSLEVVDSVIKQLHSMGKIVEPVKLNLNNEDNLSFEYTGFLLMQ